MARLNPRRFMQFAAGGIAVVLLLSIMPQFRAYGLTNASAANLLSQPILDTSEGVVRVMTQMVDYFENHEMLNGASHMGVLTSWVPRAVWPSKPVLLGYWFPREYGLTGFSDAHSVSAGFGGDAYADFGYWGGLLTLFLVGLMLGALDRWASQRLQIRSKPTLVLIAPLYGMVFFAVRSLFTAAIVLAGMVLWGAMYGVAVRSDRPRLFEVVAR